MTAISTIAYTKEQGRKVIDSFYQYIPPDVYLGFSASVRATCCSRVGCKTRGWLSARAGRAGISLHQTAARYVEDNGAASHCICQLLNRFALSRTVVALKEILWCVLAVQGMVWAGVEGHGRLIEPPSRASAWRFGFDTPHNYNDHELYCGGFTRQWQRNGGKCGVCGDAWDGPIPRPHELGGRFGKGVIVHKYAPKDTIVIKVELTASHMGYFEFRVCNEPKATTQECLDRNVLKLESKNATKYFPKEGNKVYEMKYQLPDDLECSHCVLQWKYIAGNNWGTCEDGSGAVGCGPQEEFRACADIAIGDKFTTSTRRPRPTYVPPSRTTTAAPTPEESTGSAWYGLLIAIVTLFVAVAVLAAIYLYYYRGGMRIKNLLKSKAAPLAPVPPPRHKRSSLSREQPPVISSPKPISEAGFETVDLRSK